MSESDALRAELTVAAIVEQNGRFLIVEELVHDRAVLNQPAGHVEPGELLAEAVIRETLEETAWEFEPDAITGIYLWHHPSRDKRCLRVSFCGRCSNHDPRRTLDDGIIRALWLTREELAREQHRLRTGMVLRSIDDYRKGIRHPTGLIQELEFEQLERRAAVV